MANKQLGYHFGEGTKSIFSHGLMSFAAVCMIVACLLIMGSFTLIAVNVDNMLVGLEKDNEFMAYVSDEVSREDALALEQTITQIPNVGEVIFVTKEEALARFQEEKDSELFADLPDNVLQDRYRIHVNDLQTMSQTVDQVRQVPGIADVSAELEIAQGFVMLRDVATALALILVAVLVTISLFIIANTIKLATFTRREEIAIMRMCGATNWFIRWPFVFEGIMLGIFGAVVSFGLEWALYSGIQAAIEQAGSLSIITMLPFQTLAIPVFLAFLVAGFLIGALGSVLAIRKFLRV